MRHLVFCFTEREGSSALVTQLGRHPALHRPIFEELDWYQVAAVVPEARRDRLPAAFAALFRTGRYDPAFFDPEAPSGAVADRRLVLKWRPWGDAPAIAERFAAGGAGVVLLMRRDPLGLLLSRYLGVEVFSARDPAVWSGHLQFVVGRLPEAAQAGLLATVRETRFAVPPAWLACHLGDLIAAKRQMLRRAEAFRSRGVPVRLLFYEDYVMAPDDVLRPCLDWLGLEGEPAALWPDFRKVNRADLREQLLNRAELEALPWLPGRLAEYATVCQASAALAGGS